MEERALHHGWREVGGRARVLEESDFVSHDFQVGVETYFEIGRVGMALAGHPHVGHAVEHQLHRLLGDERAQRRQRGPRRGLVFLASKTTAEARHVHFYLVHAQAQNVRGVALHGRGPLGR